MNLYNKLDLYGYDFPINFKVNTIIQRDEIPIELRTVGMTCYVIEEDETYRLKDDIYNINWEVVKAGSNIITNNFTILINEWTTSTLYPEYKYEAYITIDGLTANDIANVIFDVPSVMFANDAGILSSAEITTNNIRLFAITIPSADLNGSYTIIKGV